MSASTGHQASYVSPVITFDRLQPALLGAHTNGAAPRPIYGMFVDADMSRP